MQPILAIDKNEKIIQRNSEEKKIVVESFLSTEKERFQNTNRTRATLLKKYYNVLILRKHMPWAKYTLLPC